MYFDKKPLGHINLLNNVQKPVFPMDDFFINFVFSKEDNWENLRTMLNIFFEAYAEKYNRQDGFHFIDEYIRVETQYEHYLNNTSKQPTQDLKMDEFKKNKLTYIEFQNRMTSKPPITIRASNYNGLAINKANDTTTISQVWLLAENDDLVLCGQAISNFRTREDNTNIYYPRDINIMFISLPRLMEENSRAGQLAQLLMGVEPDNLDAKLKSIADMFICEYEVFKTDEEVVKTMTVLEERYLEGKAEVMASLKSETIASLKREIIERNQNKEPSPMIKKFAQDFARLMKIEPKIVDDLIREIIGDRKKENFSDIGER